MVGRNAIAVICARGGSKRIPRKNIIPFKGKPLIAWTIEAALQSNSFERVVVSTDDKEIADIARHFGAEVPFLRDQYADDHSTVSQVVHHAVEKIGGNYDVVAQLLPACPLRTADDIKNALNEFDGQGFMLSVTKYGWLNPWWAHRDESGQGVPMFPHEIKQRSQDLPEVYCPSGAIWLANVQTFLQEKTFYGPGYRLFPLPWISAVDIDNYDDLEMAELAFNLRQKHEILY